VIASVFGGVHDFFHSGAWDATWRGGVAVLIVFWAAIVYWVWKDAHRRIRSKILVALVTLVGMIPILGVLVYMLFRPPEYLSDVRERELEIRAIERRLSAQECPVCHADVEPDFLVCPVCATKLRRSCEGCQRPLEPSWRICPYCETPVAPAEGPVTLRPEAASRTSRKAR
jgi:RNA polymerase subunit RPABC4/transcription elongation factor Spt4